MAKQRVFISLSDVETDGPTLSANSCLMIGVAVIKADSPPTSLRRTGTSMANPPWLLERKAWYIQPQPGKNVDATTTENFWNKHRDVLSHIQKHARPVQEIIPDFIIWVKNLLERYTVDRWICMPTSFHWQFLRALVHLYGPPDSFKVISHDAHCLSSTIRTAEDLYNITWRHIGSCPDFAYTHYADEDAGCCKTRLEISQGHAFDEARGESESWYWEWSQCRTAAE